MQQFTVPDLPYDYGALAPAISEEIMKLHHDVHHAGYVTKLNAALEGYQPQQGLGVVGPQDLSALLAGVHQLPDSIRTAVRNNGGGHYNHSFFWECMTPGGSAMSSQLEGALISR